MAETGPGLTRWRPRGSTRAVALVLHGGAEHGTAQVRPWRLAYLRMVPLARALHRAGRADGLEVLLLRNRLYGWNAPAENPVPDARWALERIHADHPGVPVVLVGHSMGGRVALRVADDPAVLGVCALAPWTPPGEPVDAVRGRSVLIVHGTRDRMTSPAASYAFAARARAVAERVVRYEIAGEGHAMLRRPAVWTRLMCAFTRELTGAGEKDETFRRAAAAPGDEGLRLPG
ncbi:alpha/beta hydrolase [Amycolatopsis jiangsuensis]|uniref:Alpha-beta hydrolase superfamily lysophospholipase n=1 Tax=Amycolatopsis jiangsuensis TaxID=1181879 RepID=A0A840IRM4_9PSEU|nr:alpha/beta fold hydrolase [Amycolatopsis jiangsuensis]MBB4684550.1 alpha-beta hydrolase superfamily lysophospholipase [Amycolatopsis jiangsuensis]